MLAFIGQTEVGGVNRVRISKYDLHVFTQSLILDLHKALTLPDGGRLFRGDM